MRCEMLVTCLAVLVASEAVADTVLFSDDFNSEAIGLNYSGFANWDVVGGGTVDLIGVGSSWNYFPAYGRYVDLDGSTSNPGTLQTKAAFTFASNLEYTLSFDLAGNQRTDVTDTVTVQIVAGGVQLGQITVGRTDPFQTYTFSFFGNDLSGQKITFQNSGSDNMGALLDNVTLTVVPLPPASALAGLGLLGLVARWRRAAK